MDNNLGVQPKHPKQLRKRSSSSKRSKIKEQQHIKVVYISNPLRVTLSASEFKSRVQELTGQDSGVADYMFDKVLQAPATTTTTTTGEGDQLPPTPVAFTADLQMSTSTVSSSGGSGTFNQDGSVAGGSAVDFFAEMGALLPEFCGEWELPYPYYDDSFQPFDAA